MNVRNPKRRNNGVRGKNIRFTANHIILCVCELSTNRILCVTAYRACYLRHASAEVFPVGQATLVAPRAAYISRELLNGIRSVSPVLLFWHAIRCRQRTMNSDVARDENITSRETCRFTSTCCVQHVDVNLQLPLRLIFSSLSRRNGMRSWIRETTGLLFFEFFTHAVFLSWFQLPRDKVANSLTFCNLVLSDRMGRATPYESCRRISTSFFLIFGRIASMIRQ